VGRHDRNVLAGLSAFVSFFHPYDSFWAILVIALDIWVIWFLTRPPCDPDAAAWKAVRPGRRTRP
jgi:hypothetical protein